MKKNLKYTSESSSKFWEIEVLENTHIVSFGKFGTTGQTKTKEFITVDEAKKDAEKLIKAKLKKGYVDLDQEEGCEEKWFERLSKKAFTVYKAAILKYPLKEYKYIQLHWTGQGFSLGLSTDPRDGDHEYVEDGDWENEGGTSIESVYRDLENIPYEDEHDEIEFKRNEWPKDLTDCNELEYFLIGIGLGLAYMKLEKDKKVKKYLDNMEVIKIASSNSGFGPFTYHIPDMQTKKNIVDTLLKNENEKQLVLDLWEKKPKKNGVAFLKHFERRVTKIKDKPKLTLEKAYKQACKLLEQYKHADSHEVLKPVIERGLSNNETEDKVLLEKCCDIMGQVSMNSADGCKESIYWFQKGLEFVPNGHSALSLMELYSRNLKDIKTSIEFCENHLQNIDLEDNIDHTLQCYRFLGLRYLRQVDKEKAVANYQAIVEFLARMNKSVWLDYVFQDLKLSDYESGYEIANEILVWIKPSETDVS